MNYFKIEGKQGFIQVEFIEVFGFPNDTSLKVDMMYKVN
jgi:hypothetical protein